MSTPRRCSLKGCQSLSEAEARIRPFVESIALGRIEAIPADRRDDALAECAEWIDDAVREIVRALSALGADDL